MSDTVKPTENVAKIKFKEKLYLVDVDRLRKQNPNVLISDVKKTLTVGDETEIDIHFIELPVESPVELQVEQPVVETVAVEVVEEVKEEVQVEPQVVEEVKTALDEKDVQIEKLAEAVAMLTENFRLLAEGKVEAEKSVQKLKDELNTEFQAKLELAKTKELETEKQKQLLEKQLKNLETVVPDETVRTEKNDVSKNLTTQPQTLDVKNLYAAMIFGGK